MGFNGSAKINKKISNFSRSISFFLISTDNSSSPVGIWPHEWINISYIEDSNERNLSIV